MSDPYRTSQEIIPTTKEIETDDTFVEVIYWDEDGTVISKKREWIGKPYAGRYTHSNNIDIAERPGSSLYRDWRAQIKCSQLVTFDDELIPMHRVLRIKVDTKTRVAIVDVDIVARR